jgi:glycosyltransferase involved in cell wall biosynthesis
VHLSIHRKKKVLFYIPDYHSSFFLRDELVKEGIGVNIYVPWTYPERLLWSDKQVLRGVRWAEQNLRHSERNIKSFFVRPIALVVAAVYLAQLLLRHSHIYVYGSITNAGLYANRFLPLVRVARIFGSKFFLLPSGCREDDLKSSWMLFDEGNVCSNCGYFDRCDDIINTVHFKLSNLHCEKIACGGYFPSTQFSYFHFRVKALNLELWNPNLHQKSDIGADKIKVLHSFASLGRDFEGRNIKGSNHVLKAVNELADEGLNIEAHYITEVSSRLMRFEQAKADIVVDQLIYGWFGSTALECMALGKPVICYLNPKFEETFYSNFPEFRGNLPVINANVYTVKDAIKRLALDKELRSEIGNRSRIFAESWLDPKRSGFELLRFLDIDSRKYGSS